MQQFVSSNEKPSSRCSNRKVRPFPTLRIRTALKKFEHYQGAVKVTAQRKIIWGILSSNESGECADVRVILFGLAVYLMLILAPRDEERKEITRPAIQIVHHAEREIRQSRP
jgi:hypothetical protein